MKVKDNQMFKRPKNSIIGSTADQQMDAFWAEYSAKLEKGKQKKKEEEDSAPSEFALVWHDGEKLRTHTVQLTQEERQQIIDKKKEAVSRVEKVLRGISLLFLAGFLAIIIESIIKHFVK